MARWTRLLQSLYPEGDTVCHNVLVHPPGGLLGGETLNIAVNVGEAAHGLITAPGATRFYRSEGDVALQSACITMAQESRLEWLPQKAICHHGYRAENHLTLNLAQDAEFVGWDVTALGRPFASQPLLTGRLLPHVEVPGVWPDRGHLHASDHRLMDSPLGMAGQCCLASLFFVSGTKLERGRRSGALDIARSTMASHSLHATAGASSPDGRVIAVRVLAPVVEPAMQLMRELQAAWRQHFWHISLAAPRTWATWCYHFAGLNPRRNRIFNLVTVAPIGAP